MVLLLALEIFPSFSLQFQGTWKCLTDAASTALGTALSGKQLIDKSDMYALGSPRVSEAMLNVEK